MRWLDVGVDIDEVLYPWYACAHEVSVTAGITNGVTPTQWTPWKDYGVDVERWVAALDLATVTGSLYDADPIDGTPAALVALRDAGHRVHLVTARGTVGHHQHRVRELTVAWLRDHRIEHDTLTFAADKTLVRVDAFIDDHPDHLAALDRHGVNTCMQDTVTNRDIPDPWRVTHLQEFADRIIAAPRVYARRVPVQVAGRW